MKKNLLVLLCTAIPTLSFAACNFPDLSTEMLGRTSDAVTCKFRVAGKTTKIDETVCAYRLDGESRLFEESEPISSGTYSRTRCQKTSYSGGLPFYGGEQKKCEGEEKYAIRFEHKGQSIGISGTVTAVKTFSNKKSNLSPSIDCQPIDLDSIILKRNIGHIAVLQGKPFSVKSIDAVRGEAVVKHIPGLSEETISVKSLSKLKNLISTTNRNRKVNDSEISKIFGNYTCFKQSEKTQGMVTDQKVMQVQISKTKVEENSELGLTKIAKVKLGGKAANLFITEGELMIFSGGVSSEVFLLSKENSSLKNSIIAIDDMRCIAE